MTRKHFEAIAAIIDGISIGQGGHDVVTLFEVTERLADYFASQNERFDRERFLKACGFDA